MKIKFYVTAPDFSYEISQAAYLEINRNFHTVVYEPCGVNGHRVYLLTK